MQYIVGRLLWVYRGHTVALIELLFDCIATHVPESSIDCRLITNPCFQFVHFQLMVLRRVNKSIVNITSGEKLY